MKNAANVSRGIHRMDFSRIEQKVPETLRCVVSEKIQKNESYPPVYLMKIAIMQPYFLPYIGYWQLIQAVDKLVLLDDVNYIIRGWINRNRISVNGEPYWMTLPLVAASRNRLISDIDLLPDDGWKNRLIRKVEDSYKAESSFPETMQAFSELMECAQGNLSVYLAASIKRICGLLGLAAEIIPTSRIFPKADMKGQHRILDICTRLGADEYLNLPGGRNLYDSELFAGRGIRLMFLDAPHPGLGLKSGSPTGEPLSLLDTLMMNPLAVTRAAVSKFQIQK